MSDENMDLELCLNTAIEKYGDMIYRIAVNQMKNRTDADDIFQEVFQVYMFLLGVCNHVGFVRQCVLFVL